MQRPVDFELSRRRLLIAGAASLAAPAVTRTATPAKAQVKAQVPATGAPAMSKFSFNVNGRARELELDRALINDDESSWNETWIAKVRVCHLPLALSRHS